MGFGGKMSIKDTLKTLLELHYVDQEILRLENVKTKNPHMIKKLEDEINEKKMELDEEKRKLELTNNQRLKTEKMIEEKRIEIENLKKRQYELKTNEEFRLMQKNIEEAERLIQEHEDKLLTLMVEREKEEKEYREKEKEFEKFRKAKEDEIVKLKKEMEEAQEKIVIKKDERKRVQARMDDQGLYSKYERVRKLRGGIGVAVIEKPICTGCFSTIPPQIFAEVKKCEKIYTCDNCGRILIYKEIE